MVRPSGNRKEVAQILAKRWWIGAPYDIVDRLEGKFDYGSGRVVANSPHLMSSGAITLPIRIKVMSSGF